MIQSMTGYANINFDFQHITINLSVKSINNRFFDFHSFINDEIQVTEFDIRQLFEKQIGRGKISFKLQSNLAEDYQSTLKLDENLLEQYILLGNQIINKHPRINNFNLIDLMNAPGMLIKSSLDQELLKEVVNTQVNILINELIKSQTIEGQNLYLILTDRLNQMSAIINNLKAHIPSIINTYKEKLTLKLTDALSDITINDQRIAQEFALFCQKVDIDEEISRLESHIKQFNETLNNNGLIGKKLDFISQEMLREANTLGSKSVSTITTNAAIELKVLIEQLKEQVQNIK